MADRKLLLLANEDARSGRRTLAAVRRIFPANGYDQAPVHGTVLPPVTAYERIVVLGGDGSVRHLAPFLRRAASVAIIPAGTGNNLSKALGIPQGPQAACDLALTGRNVRRIDVLEVGGTERTCHVTTQAALGFGATVAQSYARLRTTRAGRLVSYPWGEGVYRLLSLCKLVLGRRPEYELRIELPDCTLDMRAVAVFVGNHAGIGGSFFPCPGAEVDDGVIHLCVVADPGSRLRSLRLMHEVARGAHVLNRRLPDTADSLDVPTTWPECVRVVRSRGPVTLTFPAAVPPSGLLADGDLFPPHNRFTFALARDSLAVVVPEPRTP